MKTWALGAMMVGALALVACSSGGGGTGGGGSGTTTVSSTHSTTVTTSTTSGSDPCADGSDCSQCADFSACSMCEQGNHPTGAQIYNDLLDCVFCTACFTTCDSAMFGCMAPATADACDGTTADPTACSGGMMNCQTCAFAATCINELNACKGDGDCMAFAGALDACPTN